MGGGDKGLTLLGGRPILARVIERLCPQVGPLLLNANGDPARFAPFGLPVVADATEGFAGPLAGILAGMMWARRSAPGVRFIATVPADTPFFPRDLVARLRPVATGAHTIVVARSRGEVHPVIALFPVALLEAAAERLLASTNRSVKAWLATQTTVAVDFPDREDGGDPFFNVNTPADLAEAERAVAHLSP